MSAITSAIKVYHDNFLEYRITGESKYKKAADAAMTTIQTVIKNMQDQVSVSPVQHQVNKNNLEKSLFQERNALKEAEMRGVSYGFIPTWKYITIGVLLAGVTAVNYLL
jgi:hypothetical protein